MSEPDLIAGPALDPLERVAWAVTLHGADADLERWRNYLARPFEPFVEVRDGELYLRSAKLDELKTSANVRALASVMVDELNGIFVGAPGGSAISFGHVIEIRQDGSVRRTLFGEAAIFEGGYPSHFDDGGTNNPSFAQRWMQIAAENEVISDMLQNVGRENNWANLYKIYENLKAITAPIGGIESLPSEPTRRDIRDFTHTANYHRHGRMHPSRISPPENPMTLPAARLWVLKLVADVMTAIPTEHSNGS